MQLCNESFEPSHDASWNELSSDESDSLHSASDVYPHEHFSQITAAGISSHDPSHLQESAVHAKVLSFCDCPPDPQIPKHLQCTHMK